MIEITKTRCKSGSCKILRGHLNDTLSGTCIDTQILSLLLAGELLAAVLRNT